MKICTTHFHACDCREAAMKRIRFAAWDVVSAYKYDWREMKNRIEDLEKELQRFENGGEL